MHPHAANLQFVENARKPVSFCIVSCFACYENIRILTEKNALQLPSHFCRRSPPLVHPLSISPPASIDIHSVLDYALPVLLSHDLSSVLYAVTSHINLQMSCELLNALDALKTAKCSTAALRIPHTSVPFALDIDAIITRMRTWIETASISTPTELEGYLAAIRNYAAIREYFNLRDNLLGHVIATHASLNKLLIRLNCSFVLPSMRRDDLRFVATCSTFEKFRSLRAQPRSPLHLVYVGYRGELLPINLVEGEGTHPIRPDGNKYISLPIDLIFCNVHTVARPNPKINNFGAQCASKPQSPWSVPREVIAYKGVGIALRNLSDNIVAKLHADLLSNPSIALRREPHGPASNIPLADSPIVSSAPTSANTARLSSSSRESISKDFHDVNDRKAKKRRDKMNKKADFVCGHVLLSVYADSGTRIGESNVEMEEMSGLEVEEEMETGVQQPAGQANAAEQGQENVKEQGAAIGSVEEQKGEGSQAIPLGAEQAPAPTNHPLQESSMGQDTAIGDQRTMLAGTPATTSATASVQASEQGSGHGVGEAEQVELQEWRGPHRRRNHSTPSPLVVMQTGPGPPLWTAEEGRQGLFAVTHSVRLPGMFRCERALHQYTTPLNLLALSTASAPQPTFPAFIVSAASSPIAAPRHDSCPTPSDEH